MSESERLACHLQHQRRAAVHPQDRPESVRTQRPVQVSVLCVYAKKINLSCKYCTMLLFPSKFRIFLFIFFFLRNLIIKTWPYFKCMKFYKHRFMDAGESKCWGSPLQIKCHVQRETKITVSVDND